jgi:exodeoxyribonuclease V beta subunit
MTTVSTSLAYLRPDVLDAILGGAGEGRPHALIEASAGTGKTYTIENLVVELVVTGQARLEEILIVTFTEKATQELLGRVRASLEGILRGAFVSAEPRPGHSKRVLDDAARGRLERAVFGFDAAQIYTIHGFCNRVLGDNAFHNGQLFESAVLDGREIFDRAFKRALRKRFAKEPELGAFLTQFLAAEGIPALNHLLWQAAGKRHARFAHILDDAAVAAARAGDAADPAFLAALVQRFLPVVTAEIAALKRREGVLDYDDMLDHLYARLAAPGGDELLAHLRAQYKFALIDEFQDTDLVQWGIFRRIFAAGGAGRLFLIGDPKQAIYGFRGADVYAYLEARDDVGATAVAVPLAENFRSTGDVISAYNHVFHTQAPAYFTGDITYDAPVRCGRPSLALACAEGAEPVRLVPYTRNEALAETYARILQRMLNVPSAKLILRDGAAGREVTARDVFILTRSGNDQIPLAAALRAAGVPYTFYKQAGLFASAEARHVAALLRAVDEPGRQGLRLRAWATPFFGVAWADMGACLDLPGSHPLLRTLERWHELARERRFAALFESITAESRVFDRLLFENDGEREVSNYLQLFEVLTEWAAEGRATLGDLVRRLVHLADHKADGDDEGGDVLRTETDRPAVQIMTIHKSKGLEADVVFLYGGFNLSPSKDRISVFHGAQSRERLLCVGEPAGDDGDQLRKESDAEIARLYYVALTRARARLYLPVSETPEKYKGIYGHLFRRLAAVRAERDTPGSDPRLARWFADEPAPPAAEATPPAPLDAAALLAAEPPSRAAFAGLTTGAFAPLTLESYSGLKRKLARHQAPTEVDEREDDGGSTPADETFPADELRPGRLTGVFLHEALELVDPVPLAANPGVAAWRARPEVAALFDRLTARFEVPPRHRAHAESLVYTAMTAPLDLGGAVLAGMSSATRLARELEFLYPIPEHAARRFDLGANDGFTVKRGYVRGFIDAVFEAGGKVYFADWKSDALDDFSPPALEAHVGEQYLLQNRLYTLALVRMLRATRATYEARFGGLVYVFVRGLAEKADGRHAVYFARPTWDELAVYAAQVADGSWGSA